MILPPLLAGLAGIILIIGGHAENALPQRATANINCRIFPGTSVQQVRERLAEVIGNPKVKITAASPRRPSRTTGECRPGVWLSFSTSRHQNTIVAITATNALQLTVGYF